MQKVYHAKLALAIIDQHMKNSNMDTAIETRRH